MTPSSPDEVARGWFAGRLPSDWFVAAPEVSVDRDTFARTPKPSASWLGALAKEAQPTHK